MIVTIDGEAGSGKTTVASMVAERLGAPLLESGSIYRALAWKVLKEGANMEEDALVELAGRTRIEVQFSRGGNRVTVDGADVTGELRGPDLDRMSSIVSGFHRVRELMLRLQRSAAERGDLVAEGRDMGTVVFPAADFKFYLTAPLEVRAERHRLQMAARGRDIPLKEVIAQVQSRDRQDSGRRWSPMRPAEDAVIIDTGRVDARSVATMMLDKIKAGAAGRG